MHCSRIGSGPVHLGLRAVPARCAIPTLRTTADPPVNFDDAERSLWFAEKIHSHEPMLRAWLHGRFGRKIPLDDIIQEAYLRVWRARETGELHAPKAFLFTTARNLALDHLRKHATILTDYFPDTHFAEFIDEHEDVPENVERNQELALLTQAIQQLPERCRQVMTLRIVYGLKQRIIGDKLGISDRTVAAQLTIGIAKCSQYILRRMERRSQ